MGQETDKILQSNDRPDCPTFSGTKLGPDLDFAQIVNTIGEGVLITGKGWRFEYVNPAFARIVGRPLEDLIGKTLDDFIIPEDLPLLTQQRSKRLAKETSTYEFRLRRSDGEIIFVHATGVPRILGDKVIGSISIIANLTEQKKVEGELKAERNKAVGYLNIADVILVALDNHARITLLNKKGYQILGYVDGELMGKDWIKICLRSQDRESVYELNKKIATGEIEVFEYYESYVLTKKGEERFIAWHTTILKDETGCIVGTLSSGKDITERKKAEEELASEKERLEVVTQNIGAGLAIISRDYRTLWANKVLQDIFGECLGKVCYINYNQREEICPGCGAREIFDNGAEKAVNEQVGKDSTGNAIWSQIIATPLRDKGGNVTAVLELVVPITERKQAGLRLERSLARQEQLNLLQQTLLSSGKLGLKLKKTTDSVVEIFGADFCRIWITSFGDLCEVGCVHAAVTEGPHVCHYRDRCLRLIASSGRYTHTDGEVHRRVPFGCYKIGRVASGEEHKFITNDVQNDPRIHNREWAKEIGLISFAGYQLHPLGEDTLGVMALFSKQNITAEEDAQLDSLSNTITRVIQAARIDEELRQSRDTLEQRVKERTEELARRNAEMERFIYTVSHDLRSPLISMSGFLGFIEQDAQKGDLERLKNDLRIVSDSVSQMDRLLQSTLELSRIGRVIGPPEDVPFREIIGDALSQIDEKIESGGVKVSIAPDMPIVHVDRMRIVEVLINFIENSMKYMGAQEKPEIEFGQRIEGKERIFFARDNGIGIDPSQHDKVFELFNKVDKESEGTGAGLAIVKRIIEVHGGRVWIESELGKGCAVCFTLPLA